MMKTKRTLLSSKERQPRLKEELYKNPFLSDMQLAALLDVSIHTVRADRRKAGIPEVRKRGLDYGEGLKSKARSLSEQEIVGEILDIELDKSGVSLLETSADMALQKSGIVRGHMLFAQANTLANAIIDADVALTGEAHVRYLYPLYAGERITAKARVVKSGRRKQQVEVVLKTKEHIVFEGTFYIYRLNQNLACYFRNRLKSGQKGNKT